MENRMIPSQRPAWKGNLIALALSLVFVVFCGEIILRLVMPHWREFHSGWFMRLVDVPGYGQVTTGVPGFDGHFAQNNGDFRVHIKINEFGLRNRESVKNSDNRLWVVGDSMTFGWGVEEDEMYSSIIEKTLNDKTYNIASPGTNICGYQTLLARMPTEVEPRAVVMGLVLENDITDEMCEENVKKKSVVENNFNSTKFLKEIKKYLTKYTAFYNFLAVSLKRVNVIEEMLVRIGLVQNASHYKNPIVGNSLEGAVAQSINEIDRFRKMLKDGTPFLVVIVPGRFELFANDPTYARLRKTIKGSLANYGIPFVDPYDAFSQAGYGPTHFAHDGHWTALGHRLAGEAAAARLSELLKDGS